ncbi:MAG TPA: hypothetical protein VKG79_13080, partial [Bryobacteraceae bacterium]|nr:hypothetical protein [Bryobacteraceae bacterium]
MSRGGTEGSGVAGDGEIEDGSFSEAGFDPDSPAVALNHALANRQTDAGAAVLVAMMEPFEYAKDFLLIPGIDSDPIVRDRETPHTTAFGGRDVDSRRNV